MGGSFEVTSDIIVDKTVGSALWILVTLMLLDKQMVISLVQNFFRFVLCNPGACMEKVPGSCWTRVYGVIGIFGSWELWVSLSLSLSLSPFSLFSLSLSRFSQPFSKLKQWKRICKLEQITDMRYIFSAFQKQRRFCSFLFWFCAFLFATISLANLLNFYSRRLQKGNLTECLPFAIAWFSLCHL